MAPKMEERSEFRSPAVEGKAAAKTLGAEAKKAADGQPDYQLVIRADSVDAANKMLKVLFAASGWSASDAAEWKDSAKVFGYTADQRRSISATDSYVEAASEGEATWYIVTDRASVSRFADRLGQWPQLAVAGGSSEAFQATARQQDLYRRALASEGVVTINHSASPGSGAGGVVASTGTAARGGAAATTSDINAWQKAPDTAGQAAAAKPAPVGEVRGQTETASPAAEKVLLVIRVQNRTTAAAAEAAKAKITSEKAADIQAAPAAK
jgi:hypothetical protein